MKKIKIINGPNLNMLGRREQLLYGSMTLEKIIEETKSGLSDLSIKLDWWQSNSEHEIIEEIHALVDSTYDALIINPAAFSHTSIAILDALKILNIPIVEVHLTNVYSRESFRHSLLTAQAASIIMSGLGKDTYRYAVLALLEKKSEESN